MIIRVYSLFSFLYILGDMPRCFFTYFPKKERLGKSSSKAMSLMLLSG